MKDIEKIKDSIEAKDFEIVSTVRGHLKDERIIVMYKVEIPSLKQHIWVCGNDAGCTIASENYIIHREYEHDDVALYELLYEKTTPAETGKWARLLQEVVVEMVGDLIALSMVPRVYPAWLPDDLFQHFGERGINESIKDCAYALVHDGYLEFVPKSDGPK